MLAVFERQLLSSHHLDTSQDGRLDCPRQAQSRQRLGGSCLWLTIQTSPPLLHCWLQHEVTRSDLDTTVRSFSRVSPEEKRPRDEHDVRWSARSPLRRYACRTRLPASWLHRQPRGWRAFPPFAPLIPTQLQDDARSSWSSWPWTRYTRGVAKLKWTNLRTGRQKDFYCDKVEASANCDGILKRASTARCVSLGVRWGPSWQVGKRARHWTVFVVKAVSCNQDEYYLGGGARRAVVVGRGAVSGPGYAMAWRSAVQTGLQPRHRRFRRAAKRPPCTVESELHVDMEARM